MTINPRQGARKSQHPLYHNPPLAPLPPLSAPFRQQSLLSMASSRNELGPAAYATHFLPYVAFFVLSSFFWWGERSGGSTLGTFMTRRTTFDHLANHDILISTTPVPPDQARTGRSHILVHACNYARQRSTCVCVYIRVCVCVRT